jgi:hypothetical protein
MTKLEKVLLVLLILAVGVDVALLVTDDEEEPRTPTQVVQTIGTQETEASRGTRTAPARTERARTVDEPRTATAPPEPEDASGAEGPEAEQEESAGGPPPCSELDIPPQPPEAVTCRTASATLMIVGQAKPLLLGDTHVRVLRALAAGRAVVLRVRVRNETDAEQGIQAGGQELYLNVNGIRVDPQPVSEQRVPPATGQTVSLRFVLTPGQARVLQRQGGRAELGVRPWTGGGTANFVGVVRFSTRGS